MATDFLPVPEWQSWENQHAAIAVADVDQNGQQDLIVLQIDHPLGGNQAYYRIGWDLTAADGVTGGWSPWLAVPDWFAWENQGGGIAVADLNGNGEPDLIVFQIDNPLAENAGFYRVGWDLNGAGEVTGGWGPWIAVPDWFFWENQGAAITVADLDGNGQPELVLFHVDNPPGQNQGYYRIGWNLDADGNVTGDWSQWLPVPDWYFWENQGTGIAVADLDGNGRPDLVVFAIDDPLDANLGLYCVGWNLDAGGIASGGWEPWTAIPDWQAWENQGGGIAVAELEAGGGPQLIVFQVDNPAGENAGLYAVRDLALHQDLAPTLGVWRLLSYDSQVLAIHAALLHTGKVLFFAGSSNNPANAGGDFGSVVWDYETDAFISPHTPADLFCSGHAFLADGRLLVAGGTKQYDPFLGLHDAFFFDPEDEQWKDAPAMTGGRWYPTLIALGDGRVLAMSGLGENGEDPYQELEIFSDAAGWQTLPPMLNRPWPLYCHVFLQPDGQLFYTGGQYDKNYGVNPSLIDLDSGVIHVVEGLMHGDHRNQSASVLLPPVQDGRVMLIGGGAPYTTVLGHDHHAAEATDDVSVVEPLDHHGLYHHGPPLAFGRMHHNAVLLPDRTVLVCGGSGMDESRALARPQAEIYDPATDAWSVAAAARVPRLYHSIALLLPDGRVVTAGSNPDRGDEELRIELYYPSYLFRGARPVIEAVAVEVGYGEAVAIGTPQANDIRWVSLIRPSAPTHSMNTEQRLVDVPFTLLAGGGLIGTVPVNSNLAPPGWYMLFITDTQGIPSVASWVHLT